MDLNFKRGSPDTPAESIRIYAEDNEAIQTAVLSFRLSITRCGWTLDYLTRSSRGREAFQKELGRIKVKNLRNRDTSVILLKTRC